MENPDHSRDASPQSYRTDSNDTTHGSEAPSLDPNQTPLDASIKMLHLNAQSIRHKIPEVEFELQTVDIACISETWLDDSISDSDLSIQHFHPIERRDRPHSAHGGVAIYIRDSLAFTRRDDLEFDNLELLWVEVQLPSTNILVGSLYRPPNAPNNMWLDIQDNLDLVRDTVHFPIFLLGDGNSDLSRGTSKLNQIFRQNLMAQLIHQPTHIVNNSVKILDFIATTSWNLVRSTRTTPPVTSNHHGVQATLSLTIPKPTVFKRRVLFYKKADWDGLNHSIAQQDWDEIIHETADINDATDALTNRLTSLIYEHIPNKTVAVKTGGKPWITAYIRKLARKKNKKLS